VGVLAFYRGPGERWGGVAGEFNADVNGFNAIEDGGGFNRDLREGKSRRGGNGPVAPEAWSWAALGGRGAVAARASSGVVR
jgi:hypothetical protein